MRADLSDPNRPRGSFLFLGPAGVGKTELCNAFAGCLFDSEDQMIRGDLNPVSKLILQGRFGPKDVVPVDVEKGEFRFERVVH